MVAGGDLEHPWGIWLCGLLLSEKGSVETVLRTVQFLSVDSIPPQGG